MVEQYHARMPFVSKLAIVCELLAQHRGWIRLLDGARCRFDLWEPRWRQTDSAALPAFPKELALEKYGTSIKRAGTRKSMNRLIQGSSARQTKRAMLSCWQEGFVPLLQMHDDLNFDFDSPSQGLRVKKIMEQAVRLRVPMKVDLQYGWNWGQASEEPPKGVAPPSFEELKRHGRGISNDEIYGRRAA